MLVGPVQAQSSANIEDRIESTFGVLLGNSAELAVPLTRRALARRSAGDGDVEPLSFGPVEDASPASLAIEQIEDDPDLARLPRPRPVIISEATGTSDMIGQPLDLVAGAAAMIPEEPEAPSEPAATEVIVAAAPADEEAPPEATERVEAEVAAIVESDPPPAEPTETDIVAAAATTPKEEGSAPPAEPEETDVAAAPDIASPYDELPRVPKAAPGRERNVVVAVAAAPASDAPDPEASSSDAGQGELATLIPTGSATQAPDLVARTCLSVDDATDKDGDLKRNAERLGNAGLCLTEDKFRERKRDWIVHTLASKTPGPLWAVMHDDEDVSFDNGVKAVARYGGALIAIEAGGERNVAGIDPNRNFSADGVGCRKVGKNASPRFTGIFADLMRPDTAIVALHNNAPGRSSKKGLGHVSMETVPESMDVSRPNDPEGPLAGKRALVLLTDTIPVSTTSKRAAEDLAASGINAVIEKVRKGRGDCSLSNYAVLTGHKHYLNITVDGDEREKQMLIIDLLMSSREKTVAAQQP